MFTRIRPTSLSYAAPECFGSLECDTDKKNTAPIAEATIVVELQKVVGVTYSISYKEKHYVIYTL